MNPAKHQMQQDKLLRDAALALVKADVDRLKSDFQARSLGERAMDRAIEGAEELVDEAQEMAADNKGVLALLLGAVAVWFARNPILDALGFEREGEEEYD